MRFTLTAQWADGSSQRDEYDEGGLRAELAAMGANLDGLLPGEAFTFERIS